MSDVENRPAQYFRHSGNFGVTERTESGVEESHTGWRSGARRGRAIGPSLRQPRYPRRVSSSALRPVALRPRLSTSLPEARDYAQSATT